MASFLLRWKYNLPHLIKYVEGCAPSSRLVSIRAFSQNFLLFFWNAKNRVEGWQKDVTDGNRKMKVYSVCFYLKKQFFWRYVLSGNHLGLYNIKWLFPYSLFKIESLVLLISFECSCSSTSVEGELKESAYRRHYFRRFSCYQHFSYFFYFIWNG